MESFDIIVIGGGSAGYAAARTAREKRERVAIIDSAAELGGLCILRGCMPSKTLIYSAEIAHLARHGKLFGLDIPQVAADMPELHRRKLRMTDDFAGYRRGQLESERFTLIRERAEFFDETTIVLQPSGMKLTADAFVIATGSVVNFPAIPGLADDGVWTSDDILDLDFLPPSLVMLGGGIVACELAQFLQRMGTEVTLVQRSARLLKEVPEAAGAEIERVFRAEGMKVFTGTALRGVVKNGNGFTVAFEHEGETKHVTAAHVCNALGRVPNTRRLRLENAGVKTTDRGGILVNTCQQSSNPRVYAAGDVCGPYEIVHIAILQGELAAKHALGENPPPLNYDDLTSVVFTDPQIATAGIPREEARSRGHDLIEADYPFDDHGKSILMEARHGYVKAWADRQTGRLLGAECVGKDAGELIHSMAVAVALKATVRDLIKVQWYHPTLSEIWSYPLEDLAEQTG